MIFMPERLCPKDGETIEEWFARATPEEKKERRKYLDVISFQKIEELHRNPVTLTTGGAFNKH